MSNTIIAGLLALAREAGGAPGEARVKSAMVNSWPIDDSIAFKNFHRALCARFGYMHDEKDWRRDQLSLTEHIAKQVNGAGNWQALAARGVREGVHPELASELLAIGWRSPLTIDGPATKTVRFDLSALEVEGELRKKVIEMGWTPPGAIEATAAGAAAREAYDNTFHKVRAEVSFDWWCRIWLKALAWAGHAPRSLEETDLEILRKADARVGDFERLLEEIGIERRGRELVLTLTDAGGAKCWDITFLDADGASARTLANWMMRKQALLHGESWPGHAAAAAAMMTAPNDEQKVQLTGEVSSDDRNAETMSLRLPTGFFCGPLGKAYEEPKWTEWDGSSQPGAWALTGHLWPKSPFVGVKLRVRFRDGDELETDAPEQMRWAWSRPYVSCADIVAYRVLD